MVYHLPEQLRWHWVQGLSRTFCQPLQRQFVISSDHDYCNKMQNGVCWYAICWGVWEEWITKGYWVQYWIVGTGFGSCNRCRGQVRVTLARYTLRWGTDTFIALKSNVLWGNMWEGECTIWDFSRTKKSVVYGIQFWMSESLVKAGQKVRALGWVEV